MEKRGAVNFYGFYKRNNGKPGMKLPKGFGEIVPVINLSNGVTPMFHVFGDLTDPEDRAEYSSNMYRIPKTLTLKALAHQQPKHAIDVLVTHCHYRPTRDEFSKLDKATQEHVLNGGLLIGVLGECVPLPNDPVTVDMEAEPYFAWAEQYYGRTPPMVKEMAARKNLGK